MLDLAENGGHGNVALKDVAQRQAISEKYLWQIVNRLKTAGLIRAVPGARGGFALTRTPDEISLHDLLSILEGDQDLTACVAAPELCDRSDTCRTRLIWQRVGNRVGEALQLISLQDMLIQPVADEESRKATRQSMKGAKP